VPVTSTSGQGRKPGVPNKATQDIKALAQVHGPAVIARLAELAGLNPKVPAADNQTTQVIAMKELMDRGYGKSPQAITGADGGAVVSHVLYTWEPKPE
jgi:hypothetical protein